MNSLRWRIALWFAASVLAVLAVFMGITYTHLEHELRREKWERAPAGTPAWTLHGSYRDEEVRDIAGELWQLSLVYAVPVALLALAIGYYLARRSLDPVTDINRQLQTIGPRNLQQRLRTADADAEFRSIERSINSLLARLEDSFGQLSEFSGKVAHELRTPLTLLRLQVEEAAGRIEPALAESLQDELSRLSDYVDQCLLLATAEQGRLAVRAEVVPLRALVSEMIEVYALLAREAGREIVVRAPEEVVVTADARHVRAMLHNLLTNAVRHGVGPIEITLGAEGAARFCRVENALSGPPPVFRHGSGLGLRIVRALATVQPRLAFAARAAEGRHVAELRWADPAPASPPSPVA